MLFVECLIVYQMFPGASFRLVDSISVWLNGPEIEARRNDVFKVTQLVN